MQTKNQKISPFLWFESEAEAAAKHYVAAFPGSRITRTEHYPEGGMAPVGSVMTVGFELSGQHFTALNGGPMFKPTEAVSFVVSCVDQKEIDFLWDHLAQGGSTSMCGWLKDRWGFSWQIVPQRFLDITARADASTKSRVFAAMMQMTKFDMAAIERAASLAE
jgi:predicted 3-demethylubiquinone-9 3-methyltransferase (glyoxalase superfamily)